MQKSHTDHVTEYKKDLLVSLLILAVVFVSYGSALSYRFVMDDFSLFVQNPNIKSWANIPHIFTSGYWDSEGLTRGLYRPFTIFTFLVEYSLGGARPFLPHLDNVLLHFICSVLVYLILKKIFGRRDAPAFAALIFAAHPVHTEAVTWISGRAELLSAALSLLALHISIGKPGRSAWPFLTFFVFLAALLSKESAAVMPVLLAAYLLLFTPPEQGRGRIKAVLPRLYPYIAAFAVAVAARMIVLGGEMSPEGIDQALYGVGPYGRFLTMSRAFYEYIRLGLFPYGLKLDYFFPPPGSLLDIRVLLPYAVLAATLLFATRIIRSSRPVFFAAVWFFVTLLPVSNIIPSGIIMSERAMYLPSLAACILIGAAIAASGRAVRAAGGNAFVPAALFVPVLAAFSVSTINRNPVWADQERSNREYSRMLDRDIDNYPDYAVLYRTSARMQEYFGTDEADKDRAVARAADKLGPDDSEMHALLARRYAAKGMHEKALSEITVALRTTRIDEYYDLAGMMLYKLKRLDEAEKMFDEAVRLNPGDSEAYMDKGEVRMELGDDEGALRLFEKAAYLDPQNHDAYLEQGIILDSRKQFGPAIEKVRKAVELDPASPDLRYFLAVAYMDGGKPEKARKELEEALRLRPGFKDASALLQKIH